MSKLSSLGVEDVSEYSTHSMRKTKPSVIYEKTHNVDAIRRLLGQSSVTVHIGVYQLQSITQFQKY